jgi:hypothetical protein
MFNNKLLTRVPVKLSILNTQKFSEAISLGSTDEYLRGNQENETNLSEKLKNCRRVRYRKLKVHNYEMLPTLMNRVQLKVCYIFLKIDPKPERSSGPLKQSKSSHHHDKGRKKSSKGSATKKILETLRVAITNTLRHRQIAFPLSNFLNVFYCDIIAFLNDLFKLHRSLQF